MSMPRRGCPAKEPALVWCECPAQSNCVLEEFRAMALPGGRKQAMENYRNELRIRQTQLNHGGQKP